MAFWIVMQLLGGLGAILFLVPRCRSVASYMLLIPGLAIAFMVVCSVLLALFGSRAPQGPRELDAQALFIEIIGVVGAVVGAWTAYRLRRNFQRPL